MFFTLTTSTPPAILKVDQGVTILDLPFTQVNPTDYQVEIDESVVFPLEDLTIQVDSQPSYAAIGFADGNVVPLFISLSEADRYFRSRLHGEIWTPYSDLKKSQSLAAATDIINSLAFSGLPIDPNQLLEFPRGCDRLTPQPIRYATAELALTLASGTTLESKVNNLRVTSRRFSGVGTTLAAIATPSYLEAGVISIAAWKLLQPYLREQSENRGVRLYRAS